MGLQLFLELPSDTPILKCLSLDLFKATANSQGSMSLNAKFCESNLSASNILKHFRNAPLYFLLFLPHGLVEDIFLVIYHVRVQ